MDPPRMKSRKRERCKADFIRRKLKYVLTEIITPEVFSEGVTTERTGRLDSSAKGSNSFSRQHNRKTQKKRKTKVKIVLYTTETS